MYLMKLDNNVFNEIIFVDGRFMSVVSNVETEQRELCNDPECVHGLWSLPGTPEMWKLKLPSGACEKV